MRYSVRTITALNALPLVIDVDEAKAHLRVDFADDDTLIEALLRSAQDHVELHTGQVLTERELEVTFDDFPSSGDHFIIPRAPVTAITSLKYDDSDGAEQTVGGADYVWRDTQADQLMLAPDASWPSGSARRGSVRLRFMAGYEAGLAPASLVAAVKLMLGHLYGNREAVVTGTIATDLPLGVVALCAPYRPVGF